MVGGIGGFDYITEAQLGNEAAAAIAPGNAEVKIHHRYWDVPERERDVG